jgi:hypothetical protein
MLWQNSLADGENLSAAFSVLMILLMCGMRRIHGWSAQSGFLVVDKWKVPGFQT